MNYYQHHIGDYRRDTAHLSLLEHGIYRQLLDMYYLSETKIPAETEVVCRRLCARTDDEKKAVNTILAEFFKWEDGWTHTRCEKEITAYQTKSDRARNNGKLGGRPSKTKVVNYENQEITQDKANHKPLTNNQEPLTNNKDLPKDRFGDVKKITHDVLFETFWKAYPKKEAKGAAERAWAKIRDKGKTLSMILEALRWQASSDLWEQGYIPHPATYLNAKRWLDENPVLTNQGKLHEQNRPVNQPKLSLCERATLAREETERRLSEREAYGEFVGENESHLPLQMVVGNGVGGRKG